MGADEQTQPAASQTLPEVVVTADAPSPPPTASPGEGTAYLLQDSPGLTLQQNGSLATVPTLHGLGDERVKILVDGMTISAACPNHMNPALSYTSPGNVAGTAVITGITPVSQGGDSLGGTIAVNSASPAFASGSETLHEESTLSGFYGSNNGTYGGSASSSVATHNLSLGFTSAWSHAGNYTDGHGNTVTSTYYETSNEAVTLAAQNDGNFGSITGGLTQTPNEGFVGEWMDLTKNEGGFINGVYKGTFDWGTLDARAFFQKASHEMNLGFDKRTFPNPMWMPMDTDSTNAGYTLKPEIPFSENNTLRVGNELYLFKLKDWWPAVPFTEPMMGPNTFVNINNGHRDRLSFYAEWETKWTQEWTTIFGVRNDSVWMDTGPVHGYSFLYASDANAFNNQDRSRTDINFDLTGQGRYEPNPWTVFDFGYARKTRSPSLYERYAWSTDSMASAMVNWFNDGNSYVGNPDLKPEVAHTLSVTADFHDPQREDWGVTITPYFSYVENYIDVDLLSTMQEGNSTVNELKFANHDATISGVDLTFKKRLWESPLFGRGEFHGLAGVTHGERIDTGGGLYHIMPLNARLTLEETLGKWTSAIELQLVDSKTEVDNLRNEPKTPGYALVNLRTGYQWRNVRVDVGINNLCNQFYYLPLGGVNLDNFMASGYAGAIQPLAGMGRTFFTSVTIHF